MDGSNLNKLAQRASILSDHWPPRVKATRSQSAPRSATGAAVTGRVTTLESWARLREWASGTRRVVWLVAVSNLFLVRSKAVVASLSFLGSTVHLTTIPAVLDPLLWLAQRGGLSRLTWESKQWKSDHLRSTRSTCQAQGIATLKLIAGRSFQRWSWCLSPLRLFHSTCRTNSLDSTPKRSQRTLGTSLACF